MGNSAKAVHSREQTRENEDMVKKVASTFEEADVIRMFPSFVWKTQLKEEIIKRVSQDVVSTLELLRQAKPGLESSLSWQSDHDLHQSECFGQLISSIHEAVKKVLEFQKIANTPFVMTGLWANMNAPGAIHKMHNHPNNFLSGVYYLQTCKGADTINFHDPRPQRDVIKPPVTELTADNTDQVVVTVNDGTLLVFPSWLSHSVDINSSNQTRISISFNVMFSEYAETLSQPLWSGNSS
jgi:uncharacterized protein (TIGR02466 family)